MITWQEATNHFYKYRDNYELRWKLWIEWFLQENHGDTKPITLWRLNGEFIRWEDGHVGGISPNGFEKKQWGKSFGYLCGIRIIT